MRYGAGMGKVPTAHVITCGCQMNGADSETMAGILRAEGYRLVDGPEEADVVLVNTCSIRAKAEQKVLSLTGRLREMKKSRPGMQLVLAGCVAQRLGEALIERAPGLDVVLGTARAARLPDLLREARERGGPAVDVIEEPAGRHPAIPVRRSSLKAWVNIMFGCDNHCAYCVVPAVRGRERSRPADEIVREVAALAAGGYREVTLLGQNVNSYGRGLAVPADFPSLLRALDGGTGIDRIRFTTSHPKDFSGDLIRAVADLPSVCEAVHLPLQAGDDGVLRRMNRGYTFTDYRHIHGALRDAVPEVAVTTDIIVGFPGETQGQFERTLRALEELRFDAIFSFRYSPREGTAAWQMGDDIPEEEKARRLVEVQGLQQEISTARNGELVGRTVEVLVEGPSRKDPGRLTGRSRGNKVVNFHGPSSLAGQLVEVQVVGAGFVALAGKLSRERQEQRP